MSIPNHYWTSSHSSTRRMPLWSLPWTCWASTVSPSYSAGFSFPLRTWGARLRSFRPNEKTIADTGTLGSTIHLKRLSLVADHRNAGSDFLGPRPPSYSGLILPGHPSRVCGAPGEHGPVSSHLEVNLVGLSLIEALADPERDVSGRRPQQRSLFPCGKRIHSIPSVSRDHFTAWNDSVGQGCPSLPPSLPPSELARRHRRAGGQGR